MEFTKFYTLYQDGQLNLSETFFNQIKTCEEACSVNDYRHCLTQCEKLKDTLKKIKNSAPFRFLSKQWSFRILSQVKAVTVTRGIPLEKLAKVLGVGGTENNPSILNNVPEEDQEAFSELFNLYADRCRFCNEEISCFECRYAKAEENKFKTSEGLKAFFYVVSTFRDLRENREAEKRKAFTIWKLIEGIEFDKKEVAENLDTVWELYSWKLECS